MRFSDNADRFWREEMRGFPHGGGAAAVWVVRRESIDQAAPLTVLFNWACGSARQKGMAERLPLGSLLRSMHECREELVQKTRDTALWVEPLLVQGEARGCLGIWFEAGEPWRESIFLWGQRLGARLGPVFGQLEPLGPTVAATVTQPTLFPITKFEVSSSEPAVSAAAVTRRDGWTRDVLLPRPMPIPGIPHCIGVSREMHELGRRLPAIARSGVNVLLRGESGTGKEIVAGALHLASGREKGPFVAQNCAALAELLISAKCESG